jgi:ribonuclease BN (tRNA processing enzyme)
MPPVSAARLCLHPAYFVPFVPLCLKKSLFELTPEGRFDRPDRRIVISGDTNPTQATIDACRGYDVLIHEANTLASLAKHPETFQSFAAKYHTSTVQLAELAAKAKPRLLIVYHASIVLRPALSPTASAPEELLKELQSRYPGKVVVGRDLDVY